MSDRGLLLLQGGRVVAADGEYDADVLIEGEKIAAVGSFEVPEEATAVDQASAGYYYPGNTHVIIDGTTLNGRATIVYRQ